MKCREFKSNHVGYIDDVLSAADMSDMRGHLGVCTKCSTLDVRIRRSLLVVRNLPEIVPSADFYLRLSEALRHAPPPTAKRPPVGVAATFAAVTAALAAAVYFAMAFSTNRTPPVDEAAATLSAAAPSVSTQMSDVAIAAAVPAGVPVWPAMFMIGELPTQFANAELLESTLGR